MPDRGQFFPRQLAHMLPLQKHLYFGPDILGLRVTRYVRALYAPYSTYLLLITRDLLPSQGDSVVGYK